jgi:CRP-like cAMP-binding protein
MDESRLQEIGLFSALSAEDLRAVSRVAEDYSEPAGTTLIGQGDFGYEFIVLEQGTAEVIRDGETIDTLGPGDFFGELAALRPGKLRNASVVASSPVQIVAITAHNMRVLRERMPPLAKQIDSVIADRTR